MAISTSGLPCRADFAARREDGALLVKRFDKAYRQVATGRWVLFDSAGVCITHQLFFNENLSLPPYAWADAELHARQALRRLGF